jgi:hypothetical protein
MANWLIAPLQFLIGIVHLRLIFLKARYISLNTASSFGNNERFFDTFLSGYRAVFGPNSSQYEQAGGTRPVERKRSPKTPKPKS